MQLLKKRIEPQRPFIYFIVTKISKKCNTKIQ